jgi:hypothetical protein
MTEINFFPGGKNGDQKDFPSPSKLNLSQDAVFRNPPIKPESKPWPAVWTKEDVIRRLDRDDRFVACALMLLHEQQTIEEQSM